MEGNGNITFFEKDVDLDRVSESAFLEYFGHVSVKRDPQSKEALNPPQYQSFSHVSGYNSAIRSFSPWSFLASNGSAVMRFSRFFPLLSRRTIRLISGSFRISLVCPLVYDESIKDNGFADGLPFT